MPFEVEGLRKAIRGDTRNLRQALTAYAEVFRDVEGEMRRKVARIVKDKEAGDTRSKGKT